MSKDAARELIAMMAQVVREGTGTAAALSGIVLVADLGGSALPWSSPMLLALAVTAIMAVLGVLGVAPHIRLWTRRPVHA